MRDRVESVSLYDVTLDILDIEELTNDDGQGRCRKLVHGAGRHEDKISGQAQGVGGTSRVDTGTGCWVEA